MINMLFPRGMARAMSDIKDYRALIKMCDKVVVSLNHTLKNGVICETSDRPKDTPWRKPVKNNKNQRRNAKTPCTSGNR